MLRRRWGLRSRPLSGLFALALRATAEQLKSAIHLVDDDLGGRVGLCLEARLCERPVPVGPGVLG